MSVGVQAQIRRNAECLRDYLRDLDEWQKECNSNENVRISREKSCQKHDEFRIDLHHLGDNADASRDCKASYGQTMCEALLAKTLEEHTDGLLSVGSKRASHVEDAAPFQTSPSSRRQGEAPQEVEEQHNSKTRIRIVKSGSFGHGSTSPNASTGDGRNECSETSIDSANALKNKGNEFFSCGKYAEACRVYTEGIGLAECILFQVVKGELRAHKSHTFSPFGPGEEDSDRSAAVRLVPRAVAAVERANAVHNSQRFEEATILTETDIALQLQPSSMALNKGKPPKHYLDARELLSVLLSNRGASLYYQKKYAESVQNCSAAVFFSRKNAKAFHRRAVAFASMQKYAEAVRDISFAITCKASGQCCNCQNSSDLNTQRDHTVGLAERRQAVSIQTNRKGEQAGRCRECTFLQRICTDYERIKASWTALAKATVQQRVTCMQTWLAHSEVPETDNKMVFTSVRILHISQHENFGTETRVVTQSEQQLKMMDDWKMAEDKKADVGRIRISAKTPSRSSVVGGKSHAVDEAHYLKSPCAYVALQHTGGLLHPGENISEVKGDVNCKVSTSECECGGRSAAAAVTYGPDLDVFEAPEAEENTARIKGNMGALKDHLADRTLPKSYFAFESTWHSCITDITKAQQNSCCGGRGASLLINMAKVGSLRNILEHCIDPNIFSEVIATLQKVGSCLRLSGERCSNGRNAAEETRSCPLREGSAPLETNLASKKGTFTNSSCLGCSVGECVDLHKCNIRKFYPEDFIAAVTQVKGTRQLPFLLGLAGPQCRSNLEAAFADAEYFRAKMCDQESCEEK